ncbi:hypothetical protein [Paraconexibacter sp.]|uniref:hypothetical protein n=1 Tax=Paraconexibacter sp. TaxID=2949640 RepID=UPI00356356CB
MARPLHIYASAFSRRERSRVVWRRRRAAALPAFLGALTGAMVLGLAEFAPDVLAHVL